MFRAKKSLGQNFLINPGVLDKIVKAAELDKDDTVIEIGPGTGVLTEKLVEKVRSTGSGQAGRVIAIEKDARLIAQLKEKFKNTNVDIVEGDILKIDPTPLLRYCATGYKLIGNIPYYITSHLLKTVFEKWPAPKLIVLMVQKEVAQRIMAKPPHMNLLALSVQFFAKPKIISYVSRGSFRPTPKVNSAIIKLTPIRSDLELADRFFKLIKTAFAGKRKQLKNTVGKEILENTGIRPELRPEELSLEDWLRIVNFADN
ncbi:MAG: ribosomal RNA small subunit methyltransferase A [Candidatus Yanofskybacteria bacterium RIFCSPHIGHO2_02_FULL_43_22]|uniref:Ribosomal RNA small subunit methyltransferase A n=1 Tax=Candidatus Yanofskybacteria bacterium RIFCSPHIGHO2_02_FULL_43_22 TaxID=1802681 RepID=A0A1F8FMV6_9BACT|nr:MAG: ribosomal RNA small subunit methyltransferase A [Candidatus Yanofskybacteria bacterium RIFCSPHIGHO2_02_FULL_43_22]